VQRRWQALNDRRSAFEVVQHLVVPEPQNAKSISFKPLIADLVPLGFRVLAALDFDY
jgi:hypothetical protein